MAFRRPLYFDASNDLREMDDTMIDGIRQWTLQSHAGSGLVGTTITFTSAPPSGTNNIQVTQLSQQNTLNSVADGAITQAKLSFDPADDATALAIALG